MHRLIKNSLFLLTLLALFGFFPTPTFAQEAWTGVCVGTSGAADVATIQGIQCLVANVLNVVMTIFAFAGFVMFVIAALIWLFTGSQPSNLEKARNTFVYAIFGLILALASFIIIQVISAFTGLDSMLTIQFLGNDPSQEDIDARQLPESEAEPSSQDDSSIIVQPGNLPPVEIPQGPNQLPPDYELPYEIPNLPSQP